MAGVYYRVVSGEPLAFCLDYRARRSASHKRFAEYSESKGAIGFVDWWGALGGLIFERDADIPKGLIRHKRLAADGSTIWKPDKRPAGKVLRAEFDALERLPSGNEFADRFGVPQSLKYLKSDQNYGMMRLNGIFPDTAFIAWVGEELFVVLPDIDAEIAAKVAEGYVCEPSEWKAPDGIIRSSRAHYELALARQKVAEEEATAT